MERILVVDDDPPVVEVCVALLQEVGYEAVGVTKASVALDRVSGEAFDLVLADIVMPEIDGFGLIDAIHEIDPSLGVVIITAYGTLEMSIEALGKGAQGFIVKPFEEKQLETAVGNALARRRLARESFRLEALIPLFEISQQFMQSSDLDSLLHTIVQVCQRETGANRVALLLFDDTSREYSVAATIGMSGDADERGVLESLAPHIVEQGECAPPVSGAHVPGHLTQAVDQLKAASMLTLPLRAGGALTGVLVLIKDEGEYLLSHTDREFLTVLGGQAAAALVSARLLEETRRRLSESQVLLELSRGMTESLQTDRLLQLVVDSAMRLIPRGSKCVIHLIGEDGTLLVPRYSSEPEPSRAAESGMPVGQGVAGHALRTRQTVLVSDVRGDPRFLRLGSGEGLRALLVSPLFVGDRDIGTLSINSAVRNAFGPGEERLVTTLAHQAAVALQQAHLVGSLVTEKRRMEAIIESMADGLVMFDRAGRVTAFNPALERMLGVSSERVIGRAVSELEDDEGTRHVASICSIETPVEDLSIDQRILQVHSSAVLDSTGGILGFVRVVHDITQLREADRLKSEFISNVSHELRTPLFSIRGFL